MTENEAIKEIETSLELAEMCTPNKEREKEIKAYKIAIQALEEIQQYRAIGTIEEFKALKEKSVAKKLVEIRKIKRFDGYDMGNCPICGEPLDNSFYENLKYCFVCGQAIDWSEEDE